MKTQKTRNKRTEIPTKRITLAEVQDFYRREFGDYLRVEGFKDHGTSHAINLEAIVPIEIVVPLHVLSPATFLRDYMASESRKKDEKRFGKILNHFKDLGFTEILGGEEGDIQISGWYDEDIVIRPSRFQRGYDLERELIDEAPNSIYAPAGEISGLAGFPVNPGTNFSPRDLCIQDGMRLTPKMLEMLADSLKFREALDGFCKKHQIRNDMENDGEGPDISLFTLDLSKKGIAKFVKIVGEDYPLFLEKQKSENGGLLRPKGNLVKHFTEPDYDLNVDGYYNKEELYLPKGLEMVAKCLSGIYRSSRRSNH